MNLNLPDTLFNGILLCISLQLIAVGIWHFIRRKFLSIGLICYIIGTGWIYSLYFPALKHSVLANIFLSGYKELAIFPLFYIFLLVRSETTTNHTVYIKHLLVPFLISLLYLFIKLVTVGFFDQHKHLIIISIYIIGTLIFLGYFVLCVRFFNVQKVHLKFLAYKRYLFVFIFISVKEILGNISFYIVPFLGLDMEKYYFLSNKYLWLPLDFLFKSILLVFAFMEIEGLGRLLFGKKVYNEFDSITNENQIKNFIHQDLILQKVFKNREFNLKKNLEVYTISEKDFRLFIKRDYNMTVNEFINDLKLKEFVEILKGETFHKYNIDSLLEMAGFNSRATLYRLFKEEYKMTPLEYLKKQQNAV